MIVGDFVDYSCFAFVMVRNYLIRVSIGLPLGVILLSYWCLGADLLSVRYLTLLVLAPFFIIVAILNRLLLVHASVLHML